MKRATFLNDLNSSSGSSDDDGESSGSDDVDDATVTSSMKSAKRKRDNLSKSTKRFNENLLEDNFHKQNIIFKLINRERTGYFATNCSIKVKQNAFSTVPNRLSFCLKEIVPFCYLTGHVFMGLTSCGQFMLSYKVTCDEEAPETSYNFSTSFKYELFFWIYRPHNLLVKYYKICLFDDHGVDNLKVVTMTQWLTNQRMLVVHGAGEFENEDSYFTIVAVPKLGCLDCIQMRNEYYPNSADSTRCAALCIKCNLTIHTKYTRSESDPKFDPKINLNCPERIVILTNGLIHMLNVELEPNKPQKICSNSLDISYIYNCDKTVNQTADSKIMATKNNGDEDNLQANYNTTKHNHNGDVNIGIKQCDEQLLSSSSTSVIGGSSRKNGCEAIIPKENIVARIIADFAECETDYPSQEKVPHVIEKKPKFIPNKYFEELEIACSGAAGTSSSGGNKKLATDTGSVGDSIECSSVHHNNKPQTSSTNNYNNNNNNKVRLLSYRSNNRVISKTLNTPKISGLTTIDLQSSSSSSSASSTSTSTNKNMDKAAKAYEFSEDTEKYEKISIFRKRRLADKKYEFSEDNSENIIPFTKLRLTNKNLTFRSKLSKPSSLSPGHSHSFFNSPNNFDLPLAHTHRTSPSHGFRSPCGSPVGNRFIMSPPSGRNTGLYGKSPTYTKPFSSPRHLAGAKRTYFDLSDSLSINPLLSPRSDEFEIFKTSIQPLSEVKPSNIDVNNSSVITNTTTAEKSEKDKPICSKKLVRRYVEEDDATSVITSEEDDCISPGYHTSLPVEVHGSCYCDMQMISKCSYTKLKCPVVVITQHTFDLETLTYHIANYLCTMNNKIYGFFYDWACEPVNICPLSSILTCILVINFTATELNPLTTSTTTKQYPTNACKQNVHYECRTLFTWDMESGDWNILDYGDMNEISPNTAKRVAGELNLTVKKVAQELSTTGGHLSRNYFEHLRILDSCTDKSKDVLRDYQNSIEFYRSNNSGSSVNDNFSDNLSDFD